MGTMKVTLYLRMEIIFACITYIFHPIFIKVPYRRSGQDFVAGSFVKIGTVKAILMDMNVFLFVLQKYIFRFM
jgi:hypothetical protein